MKKILKFTVLSAFLLMFAGLTVSCNEQDGDRGENTCVCLALLSQSNLNCLLTPFLGGFIDRPDEPLDPPEGWFYMTYIIKGIALDAYKYGRRIILVEDLLGNFQRNIGSTFMVWGNPGGVINSVRYAGGYGRQEFLACHYCYRKGDTLIMLLLAAQNQPEHWEDFTDHLGNRHRWIESSEDFRVMGWCRASVLWLRNGYVEGHIWSEWIGVNDGDGARMVNLVYRMPWHDFQSKFK